MARTPTAQVVSLSARRGKTTPVEGAVLALERREKARLAALEQIIGQGLKTFVDVGRALAEIRNQRLYREEHGTFERYCEDRWGIGTNYANKQIAAAEVVETLGTDVPIPENEAQARQLAPLLSEPELLRDVWNEAQLDGKPTADKIEQIVRRRLTVAAVLKPRPRALPPEGSRTHQRAMDAIEQLVRIAERWTDGDCLSLAPPAALKQLRRLEKVRDFLPDVIKAVEYRAATPHQFMGR